MAEDYYTPKEVKVESFWGAVACFILFQIFGYFIFQAFLFYLDSFFMILYGSIWLITFMFFQSMCINKIEGYLSKKSLKDATLSLRQIDDWIKFTLTIVLVIVLIFFIFGYYPFPKKEFNLLSLALFYVFSWVVSWIFSRTFRKSSSDQSKYLKYQGSLAGGFIIGLVFVFIAYFFSNSSFFSGSSFNIFGGFYLFGMVGLGLCMMCSSIWLLADQIKQDIKLEK